MTKERKKKCRRCGVTKPLSAFKADSRYADGRISHCRQCANKSRKAYSEQHPGYDRERAKQYWAKHPDKREHNRLTWRYGITPEEYVALLLKQNGVCAICGKPETRLHNGKVAAMCVDHDHVTGVNRGLLCARCNSALGLLGEDPQVLHSAIRYLMFWQETK